jgi:hypothetical protein
MAIDESPWFAGSQVVSRHFDDQNAREVTRRLGVCHLKSFPSPTGEKLVNLHVLRQVSAGEKKLSISLHSGAKEQKIIPTVFHFALQHVERRKISQFVAPLLFRLRDEEEKNNFEECSRGAELLFNAQRTAPLRLTIVAIRLALQKPLIEPLAILFLN